MWQAWMKLAVAYWRDPKWDGLGPMHEALYVRLLGYTVEHQTGGFIPAHAIALCGRGIRNRDKLVADLVTAQLLHQGTSSDALAFPPVWHQWQSRQRTSELKMPGQGGSLVRDALEESREEERSSKDLDLKVLEVQAQAREPEDSDSARWNAIMSDLASNKPVIIDGQLCTRVNGQWEPINGSTW